MNEQVKPTVEDLIVDRVRSGSRPGNRRDPYKLGAVIGAGSMAGAVTGGEVTAFQAMGALPAFDSIYSNSSGDCAAKYWVSGQTPAGTSIYYEDINSKEFINPLGFFQGRAIMNVQYLTHDVMKRRKPLKAEKVVDAEQELHTYVASAKDATTLDITGYSHPEEVFDVLHWTIRMPVIAGMPLSVGGRFLADGGTFIGTVPFLEAIDDGCTHVAVLLARHMGNLKRSRHLFEHVVIALLKRDFPEMAKHYYDGYRRYEQNMRKIRDIQEGRSHEVEVEVFQPSSRIHTLETRRDILIAGAKEGYRVVEQEFAGSGIIFDRSVKIKE